MIVSWIAMHTGFHFPLLSWFPHAETVDRPITYMFNLFAWTIRSGRTPFQHECTYDHEGRGK